MTLDDPNCRNCFRFLLLVRLQFFFSKSTRPMFATFSDLYGGLMGINDCCKMGLRSLRDLLWQPTFVYPIHTIFCHSDQCVIDFVHSATTRSTVVSVIHDVDRRRFLPATPVHRRTDIDPPGTGIPPWAFPPQTFPWYSRATGYNKKCKCCAARTQTN